MKAIAEEVKEINSAKLCSIVFQNVTERNNCENYSEGLMDTGLESVMQALYYHVSVELLQFDAS